MTVSSQSPCDPEDLGVSDEDRLLVPAPCRRTGLPQAAENQYRRAVMESSQNNWIQQEVSPLIVESASETHGIEPFMQQLAKLPVDFQTRLSPRETKDVLSLGFPSERKELTDSFPSCKNRRTMNNGQAGGNRFILASINYHVILALSGHGLTL